MSNKLIFTNTIALYLRLLITLFVSLFTTRIVLKNLGVEDYGLYGTVAGIIALIAFLQNALSGATNRFFNIEMVKGDIKHIQRLFTTSLFLHVCIAVFICLALEIVGVIGLKYYIHIPDGKLALANNVLHLSILSLLILILTIPFEALLIAKENFKAYAFISVFETFAKLAVAYSLVFFASEKLVYYAFGLLLSTLLTRSIYILVTKHLYQEVRLKAGIDKGFLKQIFSFVSWDLYGNFAVILRVHGTTLIMNNFFGLVMVASIQIGNQILAALSSFSGNFLLAVKPQLMKSYAENDAKRMNELTIYSAKYSYYLMLILCVPIIMNLDFILKLWLVSPPTYTRVIASFLLVSSLIGTLFMPFNFLIHATGNIKAISFVTGTIIISAVPIIYLMFYTGHDYYWNYILDIVISVLCGLTNLIITKKLVKTFLVKDFIRQVLLNITLVSMAIGLLMFYLYQFNSLHVNSIFTLILSGMTIAVLLVLIIFILGINKEHRNFLKTALAKKLHLKKLS